LHRQDAGGWSHRRIAQHKEEIMTNRSTIAALILAVAFYGGTARADEANDQGTHHPAGAAASGQGAMPMGEDDESEATSGMPMMGDMMQMMGRMMQMMPQMCGDMMQGGGMGSGMTGRGMMGRGMMGQGMMGQGMMGQGMMGQGMMAQGMAGRGMGRWAGHDPLRHLEGTLAFYRAELGITDAQGGAWNAFADAVRAAAKGLAAAHQAASGEDGSAPDQMQRSIALLSAHLEALKQIQAAAVPLYAALTPEQKKAADELMSEHGGRMWR
jgi:hypothetical protein